MISKFYRLLPHLLFAVLVVLTVTVKGEDIDSFIPFLIVAAAAEIAVLVNYRSVAATDIGIVVFVFLNAWEYYTTRVEGIHTMLYPCPQNVFWIFVKDYAKILEGVGSSINLIATSFGLAIILGVGLGLTVGISDRLTKLIMPIVKVISPIPPIIYSPYAVALMPTFRSASVFVVALTIFWSIFMGMVLSVSQIDKRIMDSAKTLNLSKRSLIWNVLLPYSVPGIFDRVTVSVSTSFLILTSAEMMGGNSGLGWYIKYQSDFANYTRVVAGIITIGVVVTLINRFLAITKKYVIRWR